MSYQIGDLVFQRSGQPGLIVGRDQRSRALILEPEGEKLKSSQKYGYINGLSPKVRADYEAIVDKVREVSEPQKRVEQLGAEIEALGSHPENFVLRRYLESEKAHIMNTFGVRPSHYKVDEDKII